MEDNKVRVSTSSNSNHLGLRQKCSEGGGQVVNELSADRALVALLGSVRMVRQDIQEPGVHGDQLLVYVEVQVAICAVGRAQHVRAAELNAHIWHLHQHEHG